MGLWLKQLPIRYFFSNGSFSSHYVDFVGKCWLPHTSQIFFFVAIGNLHQVWVDSHKHWKSSTMGFSLPSLERKQQKHPPEKAKKQLNPAKERTFLVTSSGFFCNAISGQTGRFGKRNPAGAWKITIKASLGIFLKHPLRVFFLWSCFFVSQD